MGISEDNSIGSQTDVESVLREFDGKKDLLERFCTKSKGLIEAALRDAAIPFQSVQERVKSREKLRTKYLDPTKGYKKLDDITDQAGLRVITYYEDEVDKVAEVIRREFDVDPKRSIDKREIEPEKFGYHALNIVCCHALVRASDVEYKKFAGIWCEIQITSIFRHAWSEIQHPWYDMKDAFPAEIRRRFARMAALLEIAESEFLDLRKQKSSYIRSIGVQVDAGVPQVALDAVSLEKLLDSILPPQNKQSGEAYSVLVDELADFGIRTTDQLKVIIQKHLAIVLEEDSGKAEELAKDAHAAPHARKRAAGKNVYYIHVGLARAAMKREFGKRWEEYMLELARRAEKMIDRIRFDYLPDSLTNHGWRLGYERSSQAIPEFSAPTGAPVGGALAIVDNGPYFLDYAAAPHQARVDWIAVVAKFSVNACLYVKVRIRSKAGSQSRVVWLAHLPGHDEPKRAFDNEWNIYLQGDQLDDGWTRYTLPLRTEVEKSFGADGWAFDEFLGIRIRGTISISPLTLYRTA